MVELYDQKMKILLKTVPKKTFIGHIYKFETINNFVPDFDVSQDLKKLDNEIKKEKISPLDKESINFVINFIKEVGTKEGLYSTVFYLDHNNSNYKIKFITRDSDNPKISIEGRTNADSYVTDNNGKIIIPNQIRAGIKLRGLQNGITPKERLEIYKHDRQRAVNDIFQNIMNYY